MVSSNEEIKGIKIIQRGMYPRITAAGHAKKKMIPDNLFPMVWRMPGIPNFFLVIYKLKKRISAIRIAPKIIGTGIVSL